MPVLFDGCLTSQQHASVSQGRIYSDNFTCCQTEIEVADQTTDTGPTSPSTYPVTSGAWQGSHWYDSTPKKSHRKRDSNPGSCPLDVEMLIPRPSWHLPVRLEADALTTRPTRRFRVIEVASVICNFYLSVAACKSM